MDGRENGRTYWDKFWSGERSVDEIYSTGDRIAEALDGLFQPQGKWVLEVGAGTGRDSLRLARQGARVVTLDYSANAVRMIREQVSQEGVRVYVVLADALRMPFRKASFDLVFHQGLLEHFRDPVPLLQSNVDVLKPGGLLLVDVPQRYHVYTLVKHLLMSLGRWFAGWETEFTIGSLERLLRQVGLLPLRRYGDWMRPSFAYRSLRHALLRVGVQLPMYPKGVPALRNLRASLRRWFRRQRWAMYTFLDIGIVAQLPASEKRSQVVGATAGAQPERV